jgi:hypothetical protein
MCSWQIFSPTQPPTILEEIYAKNSMGKELVLRKVNKDVIE